MSEFYSQEEISALRRWYNGGPELVERLDASEAENAQLQAALQRLREARDVYLADGDSRIAPLEARAAASDAENERLRAALQYIADTPAKDGAVVSSAEMCERMAAHAGGSLWRPVAVGRACEPSRGIPRIPDGPGTRHAVQTDADRWELCRHDRRRKDCIECGAPESPPPVSWIPSRHLEKTTEGPYIVDCSTAGCADPTHTGGTIIDSAEWLVRRRKVRGRVDLGSGRRPRDVGTELKTKADAATAKLDEVTAERDRAVTLLRRASPFLPPTRPVDGPNVNVVARDVDAFLEERKS